LGRSRSTEQCGRHLKARSWLPDRTAGPDLEGGIIREIAVKDGDAVEANQVLVRMDGTAANSKLRRLVSKKYRLLAMKARLEAEMSSSETIETPAAFSASALDPEIKAVLERNVPN